MTSAVKYDDDELLPLSGLQHLAFCPRQWALIQLEQQWQDNWLTVEGDILHERVDDPEFGEKRRHMLTVRAVPLVSYRLGLSGKADVVEFEQVAEPENATKLEGRRQFWRPLPVEYKRGRTKSTNMDRVQLCAQAICLEEMLDVSIPEGAIFYWQSRQREWVVFTSVLRSEVEDLAREMHRLARAGITPPPALKAGCRRCSLRDVCVPELSQRQSASAYLRKAVRGLCEEGGD